MTLLLSEINQGMDEWSHLLFHVWYNYLSIHQLQLHSAKPLLKLTHGWVITPHSTMCMTLLMHVLKHLLVMFKHHTNSRSQELCTQLDSICFILVTYVPVFPISFRIMSLFTHVFRAISLALGQSYDCPGVSDITLTNMENRSRESIVNW